MKTLIILFLLWVGICSAATTAGDTTTASAQAPLPSHQECVDQDRKPPYLCTLSDTGATVQFRSDWLSTAPADTLWFADEHYLVTGDRTEHADKNVSGTLAFWDSRTLLPVAAAVLRFATDDISILDFDAEQDAFFLAQLMHGGEGWVDLTWCGIAPRQGICESGMPREGESVGLATDENYTSYDGNCCGLARDPMTWQTLRIFSMPLEDPLFRSLPHSRRAAPLPQKDYAGLSHNQVVQPLLVNRPGDDKPEPKSLALFGQPLLPQAKEEPCAAPDVATLIPGVPVSRLKAIPLEADPWAYSIVRLQLGEKRADELEGYYDARRRNWIARNPKPRGRSKAGAEEIDHDLFKVGGNGWSENPEETRVALTAARAESGESIIGKWSPLEGEDWPVGVDYFLIDTEGKHHMIYFPSIVEDGNLPTSCKVSACRVVGKGCNEAAYDRLHYGYEIPAVNKLLSVSQRPDRLIWIIGFSGVCSVYLIDTRAMTAELLASWAELAGDAVYWRNSFTEGTQQPADPTQIQFDEEKKLLYLPLNQHAWQVCRIDTTAATITPCYSIFTDNNGGVAVALPDGRYAGTPGCESFLNYRCGGQTLGMAAPAPWLNRPGDVMRAIGGAPEVADMLDSTTERWLKKTGHSADEPMPAWADFPQVALPQLPLNTDEACLTFTAELKPGAHPIRALEVAVDGVVSATDRATLAADGAQAEVKVELAHGQNMISLTPVDTAGLRGDTVSFRVIRSGQARGKRYVVALGVSQYAHSEANLRYAAADAEDIAKALSERGDEAATVLLLRNEQVRQGVTERVKEFLQQTQPDDEVIVFCAGHGVRDDALNYYFCGYDFDNSNPNGTGIPLAELLSAVHAGGAHHRLLLLDTCHAGSLGEEDEEKLRQSDMLLARNDVINTRGLKVQKANADTLRAAETARQKEKLYIETAFSLPNEYRGLNAIAAVSGGNLSQEDESLKNGVFTSAILKSLRDIHADRNGDGVFSVTELKAYLDTEVPKLSAEVLRSSCARAGLDYEAEKADLPEVMKPTFLAYERFQNMALKRCGSPRSFGEDDPERDILPGASVARLIVRGGEYEGEGNLIQAGRCYRQAAAEGDSLAWYKLGNAFRLHSRLNSNPNSEQNEEMCRSLGWSWSDETNSNMCFKMSAMAENPCVEGLLAYARYLQQEGTLHQSRDDISKARKYYQMAVDKGSDDAARELRALGSAQTSPVSSSSASVPSAAMPSASAPAGSVNELLEAGYAYKTKKQYAQAFDCYYQAAQTGNSTAWNNLGRMYREGQTAGCPMLFGSAAQCRYECYRRSATAPNPCKEGLLNYARCLRDGIGCPRDKTAARIYYQQAIEKGSDDAAKEIKKL